MKLPERAFWIVVFAVLTPISAMWAEIAAMAAPLWVDLIDAAWFALNLACLGIVTFDREEEKDG